ncbi:prephenate dehydratase [bacterium]|nr:prephenate dehydratase [bacterium]MBU1064463.1 prephenate dehydratase [bacterium]MBU1632959.1 prephenate dehydratase [bacterium]MBU1873640.1 prephenate dehydratase [bacterium]
MNTPNKIAFQGTHYAFSEIAARKYFSDDIETLPCRQFIDVFKSVENKNCRYGIVPVENSSTGSVYQNLDLILDSAVTVVGEVQLRIEQHLIANPGVKLDDIKMVHSHPQALQQCGNFLESLPNIETIASYDTAGSVKHIRDQKLLHAAAIASRQAAEDNEMQILKEEIEDNSQNYTRFHIIAKTSEIPKDANKTSVIFSMKNIPGALFKSLSVFALRDIDLLKIESRPMRGKRWKYLFYLDFTGTMQEERCRNAIRHLEEIASFLKVLGSYKAAGE